MEVTSVFSHGTPFMEAVEKLQVFSPPTPSVDVENSMFIDSVIEENKTYVCFCNIHARCLFHMDTSPEDILSRSSVRY